MNILYQPIFVTGKDEQHLSTDASQKMVKLSKHCALVVTADSNK